MSAQNRTQAYRVVQWATGNIGAHAMKAVIEHPTAFKQRQIKHVSDSFGQSFRHLAESLSMRLDRIETGGSYATARKRLEIAAGVLEAGTAAASRVNVTGYRGDRPAMVFTATWYATTELEQNWELRPTGWRVRVEGDTPLDMSIRFPVSPEDYPQVSPGLTAHPLVNAIPAVCAAQPGIRTAAELKVMPVLG